GITDDAVAAVGQQPGQRGVAHRGNPLLHGAGAQRLLLEGDDRVADVVVVDAGDGPGIGEGGGADDQPAHKPSSLAMSPVSYISASATRMMAGCTDTARLRAASNQ